MKQVLKIHRKVFAFLLALLLPQLAHSESYSLNVGESVNISQTAYNGGYIDNVGLANYIDPHLSFSKNYDGSAKITVNSYFNYSTTVKLVFIERYQSFYNGRNHTLAYTYYKDVTIKCNYQKPESGPKPTKVLLPERIRLNVYNGGELDYISAILVPAGAKASEYYWYDDKGTANFSAIMTTDGRYRIMGRSPGIGKISVVVDDDWTNLKASAILEIVDPNHLPPSSIFLPSSIEIGINKSSTLTPTLIPENTSTAFTWKSDDESIATVEYGKVVGKKAGTTNITLTTANQLQSTCKVTVINGSGKDDEEEGEDNATGMVGGYEYVDLGLSVKWATCNVGATSPEENGAYYAWGETNEKSSYNWNSYTHGTSMANPTHLGNDIKSTKYDAAYANWGKDWRMPTAVEIGELISKCTFKEDTVEGVKGYRATGPNGQSIFFPSAGRKRSSNFDTGCWYWSSIEDDYLAKTLSISKNSNSVVTPSVKSWDRSYGLPIRPVTSSEGTSVEPTDVTLPASKAVEIDKYITLTASLTPSNAKTELTWTSDDTSIATVSSSGVVKGIKEGTTYIHVKTANGKSAKCELTVYTNNKVTKIEINPSNLSMIVGDTQQLTTIIHPSNATDQSVTWSSDNQSVANVSNTGLIRANAVGSATITCMANDGSGVKATCQITVAEKSDDCTIIWENPDPVGNGAPYWGDKYRFNAKKTSTDGIYVISEDYWRLLKKNEFKIDMEILDKRYFEVCITTGYWSEVCINTVEDNILDRLLDNGDGTMTLTVNFADTSILKYIDEEDLVITGTEYIPLKIYAEASKLANAREVIFSGDGYATFYDSESSYILPDGITAQVVTSCMGEKLTYKTIADGSVSGIIPKGTAVMLVNEAKRSGTFILSPCESTATYSGTNYLNGRDVDGMTSSPTSCNFYKLTYGEGKLSDVFGWYWGAASGAAFNIVGHKAWLALPQTMSRSLSFSAEGEATDIDEWQDTDAPAIIYDLQGHRVNEAKGQGLYIQNGKKRIEK